MSRRSLLVGGAAAAGLVACGGANTNSGPAVAPPGFPRAVDHPGGRTEIPAPPGRIVSAMDYDDLDAVLAVGVTPVAFGFSSWLVEGLTPWASAAEGGTRLAGPVAHVSVERIAAQRPDLVVAQADLVSDALDALRRLAPTVTVALRSGDWRAGTRTLGRATGREAQAAATIDRAELALADARARLAGLSGRRVAVINRHGGQVHVETSTVDVHGAGTVVSELGLTPVDAGTVAPAGALAEEELTRLDEVDVLLVQDFVTETAALLGSPLFQSLRPVRERRAACLSRAATRACFLLSALSLPYAAREMASAISDAAAGNGSLAPPR
ncbi:ABC transporter substrate-binding protein [Pseudonocardia acaciae]|uniref:ABC transporter substrate-binding protein n=1 Tax=Pseudonocardia acaciae TaxID=551276 RepID=UPI000A483771|nr:ABC transporter substrate-binding protein [Pseudonocardia acaciae]